MAWGLDMRLQSLSFGMAALRGLPWIVLCFCVLGVPDPVRGQIVKAYIVPQPGFKPGQALEESIRSHVKGKLEAHAYPRAIQFLEKMPMTKTGKIRKNELKKL